MATARALTFERVAKLPTWFGIGGGADRVARPASVEDLVACLESDPGLKVLGDGANLLVDDDGVSELVVVLDQPAFRSVERNGNRMLVGAGVKLPKLINDTVRDGLSGLEGLGGVPATIGGAAIMNAGGAYGQFADAVAAIHAIDRQGRVLRLSREQVPFSYRHSGLSGVIVTAVELDLKPADPVRLREFHLEVMARKKASQPLSSNSAGCVFKNPTLVRPIGGIADAGVRVSAGMLIDRAGCKGMRVGGAEVSHSHANFITTDRDATAGHVIDLMDQVRARVFDTFGVTLEPEIAIWKRKP